jgi:hypothetical protein
LASLNHLTFPLAMRTPSNDVNLAAFWSAQAVRFARPDMEALC